MSTLEGFDVDGFINWTGFFSIYQQRRGSIIRLPYGVILETHAL
jgi:hypothetical protein